MESRENVETIVRRGMADCHASVFYGGKGIREMVQLMKKTKFMGVNYEQDKRYISCKTTICYCK